MPGPYTVPYAPRERFAPNARLVDLVRQSGQDAAASAERRGMISAQMWGNLGQSVSNAIGSYQQAKADEPRRELQALQLKAAKQEDTSRTTFQSIIKSTPKIDLGMGVFGYDEPAILDAVVKQGGDPTIAQKHLSEMNESLRQFQAGRMGTVKQAALSLVAAGNDPELADDLLDLLGKNQIYPESTLKVLRAKIQADPANVSKLTSMILGPQKAEVLNPGDVAFDPVTRQPIPGMSVPPKPERPVSVAPGNTVFDSATNKPLFTAPPKVEPTKYKETEFLLDGKRVKGSYDELTGKFLHNGVDVTARAQDIPPQGPAPDFEWVTRDGKPIQIKKGTAQAGDVPYTKGAFADPSMSSDYQNILGRAVMSLTSPTRREAVTNIANRLWQEGNTKELVQVIKQAAIEGENVDVKNQVLGRQATLASLRDTRTILAELKAKGVPTGWLTGNIEDLARRLGKTTNPEYVTLGNRLMGTLINYRRAATGVQFSARESADYQKMFPNYRNDLPVNLALIDGLEREMTTYDKTYWEHKLGPEGSKLIGVGGDSSSRPITHRYDPDSGQPVPVSNAR